jgi:signal transduction histidine kinase
MSSTKATGNNNSTATTNIKEMTPEQTAEAIKNIAKRIREESAKMRETFKVIRQSGAIEELTDAVREAAMAARDSAREINDVASDLKQRGVIKETLSAAEETSVVAREAAQTMKDTVGRKPSMAAKSEETATATSTTPA